MMAEVKGNNPAPSGQAPIDNNGAPVPVGVWGDSNAGIGVFGTSGDPLPPDTFIWTRAGVFGQGTQGPFQQEGDYWIPGVFGISPIGVGVKGVCGYKGMLGSAGVEAINYNTLP